MHSGPRTQLMPGTITPRYMHQMPQERIWKAYNNPAAKAKG